jgi:hypothetical protein
MFRIGQLARHKRAPASKREAPSPIVEMQRRLTRHAWLL